jgi:hypothetical protein
MNNLRTDGSPSFIPGSTGDRFDCVAIRTWQNYQQLNTDLASPAKNFTVGRFLICQSSSEKHSSVLPQS